MAITQTQVSELYSTLMGRASEGKGSAYWMENSADQTAAAASMLGSQPVSDYFGSALDTDAAFVAHVYKMTLNKTADGADGTVADAAGLAFWEGRLDGSTGATLTRAEMMVTLIATVNDINAATPTTASAQFASRVAVSNYTADTVYENPTDYKTSLAFNNSGAEGLVVTDAASEAAAKTSVDSFANSAPDAPVTGETFALTTETDDVIIGTANDDAISGDADTFQATDTIIDQSSTDNDTLTLALDAGVNLSTGTITGIENIGVTVANAGASATVTVTGMEDIALTVDRADLAGGAIAGGDQVVVADLEGDTSTVTAGSGVDTLTVNQTTAGATVNANAVATDVTVTGGGATVNASTADGTIDVDANADGAVEINAAAASTITVANASEGLVVNAAAATTVDVDEITDGATLNVGVDTATGTAIHIQVNDIDDSGVTIVAGTHDATNNGDEVILGTDGGAADTVSLTIAGDVDLTLNETNQVDNLTLTASGDLDIALTSGALTSLTLEGSDDIDVTATSTALSAATITNNATGAVTLNVSTTGAVDATDFDDVDSIALKADVNGTVTVNTAQNLILSQQTNALTVAAVDDAATDNAVTITAADDSAANDDIAAVAITLTDFATASIAASLSTFTMAGTLTATDADVIISGTKDVSLTDVYADSIDAGSLTGDLTVTLENASSATDVTTGTGDDRIELDQGIAFTLDAGAGDNQITLTAAATGSTIVTGSDDDAVSLVATNALLISTGAGDDTVTITAGADVDSVIDAGAGTADSLVFGAGTTDLSDNTNFSFAGFEELDISLVNGNIVISGDQHNSQTYTLTGAGSDDFLAIMGGADDDTIDASDITVDGASLYLDGADGVDTLIGAAEDDTAFGVVSGNFDAGSVITGGTDTADTILINSAVAVDFTVGTITGVEVINADYEALSGPHASANVTLQQGTGVTSIEGYANAAANMFVLTAGATAYEASAEADAASVNLAGEWFFLQETGGGVDSALTYFDETEGAAVTIELTGTTGAGADDTAALIAGNIVVTIA